VWQANKHFVNEAEAALGSQMETTKVSIPVKRRFSAPFPLNPNPRAWPLQPFLFTLSRKGLRASIADPVILAGGLVQQVCIELIRRNCLNSITSRGNERPKYKMPIQAAAGTCIHEISPPSVAAVVQSQVLLRLNQVRCLLPEDG